jgi:hypothetical protein
MKHRSKAEVKDVEAARAAVIEAARATRYRIGPASHAELLALRDALDALEAAEREGGEEAKPLCHCGFDKSAATRMAAAIDIMIDRRQIDARSLAGDARLDYGEPMPIDEAETLVWPKQTPSPRR